jgi:cobalt-zinc-cadmium efflux system membrane fusion protein
MKKGVHMMNTLTEERADKSGSFSWACTLVATTGLAILAVIGLLGCKEKPKAAETPELKIEGEKIILTDGAPQKTSLAVETAEPLKMSITHLTGRLMWNDDATVRIFTPVAGRVSEVTAKLGQTVSSGTPLARIDSPDFGQALAEARTAAGNLRLAERSLARAKELNEHGAAPLKDVESAEAAYTSAVSERDRSLARLSLYGGSASTTNETYLLRTPLAGVVVEKNINPGQEVRADQMLANAAQLFAPLFVISDPSKLWVQLDVSEVNIASLRPGQLLRIYTRAYPDKVFEGVLENVGDSLDPSTRTVKVRGVVDNAEKMLKAEMYVTVDLTADLAQDTKTGVNVSSKAVFLKDNQHYIFVEAAPGQYERKVVKLGTESEGRILVTYGVTAGQKVVTEGCLLLQALLDSSDKS